MKKLGITLLAAAFALPIFAATQTQTPSTEKAQTDTTKPAKKKHARKHHTSKKSKGEQTPATPATK